MKQKMAKFTFALIIPLVAATLAPTPPHNEGNYACISFNADTDFLSGMATGGPYLGSDYGFIFGTSSTNASGLCDTSLGNEYLECVNGIIS